MKKLFIILLSLLSTFALTCSAFGDGENFSSTTAGTNALAVTDGSTASYTNITVTKTGDASGASENYDWYGTNAGILASGGSKLTISGSSTNITTNAIGGNAVFSYGGGSGDGTTVTISDATITTTSRNSGGIMTTGGGIMNASNLTITTSGGSSAAIRSDKGGGTVTVNGGTYTTSGQGSPAIYSTAAITGSYVTLKSNIAQVVVIEGGNSVTLTNSTLTANHNTKNGQDSTYQAILIYQSMSGDASDGNSSFTMTGGSLANANGDIFCITNTTCTITLNGASITNNDSSGNFLRAEAQNWGNSGKNGGKVTLNASGQKITGNIIVDSISSLAMTLSNSSSFNGAINTSGQTGTVSVTLDSSSSWKLTANSYVSSFTKNSGKLYANGYTLYVNGTAYTDTDDDDSTAPAITTTSLANGTVNTAYSETLSATGTTPITWTLSGDLPDGLTLSSAGVISGIPTTSGDYEFGVIATNTAGSDDVKLSIKIDDAPTAPAITTTELADGKLGTAYSAALTATGTTPITWSLQSGDFPGGLTLYSSGTISGTPTAAGDFTFSVIALNSAGQDEATFTIKIEDDKSVTAPTITTTSLENGTVNKDYSATLEAAGSETMVWSLASGSLPNGLQLYSSGAISGTPTKAGDFTFSVNATNSGGNDTKELTIKILSSGSNVKPVVIKSTSLKSGTVSKSYNTTIKASGSGTITWEAEGLPPGLSLTSSSGRIKGKPEEAGNYSVKFTASNGTSSDDVTLTISIIDIKPKIKGTLKTGYISFPYSATFKTSAGTGNINWNIDAKLPAGLEFDTDTGTISGTPEEAFNKIIKVTATNTAGTASKKFRLKVKGMKPSIAAKTLKSGNVGEEYYDTLYATGTGTVNVTVKNLPEGLTYSDGEISGTPDVSGTFRVKVTAKNTYGSASRNMKLVITEAPTITTSTVYDAKVGRKYSFTLSAEGSNPIKWFLAGGTLPQGLSFSSKGVLSGRPKTDGTYSFTIGAYNSVGTVTKDFEIEVEKKKSDDDDDDDGNNDKSSPEEFTLTLNDENIFDDFDSRLEIIDYEVVAELGEVSVDVAGMYEFEFILNDDVPEGAKLIWLANSSKPSEDDEIAEFYDFDGAEIDAVPEERLITVSAWLNSGVIYRPALAVKRK
ncbi:MAG: putative Ig domain-containing protein [Synergistaceae bacterium]|nr:putative Ig domain-containing protein [Synergistaceae bacterium]